MLALVTGIVLAVTLMLTALMNLPGGVRRTELRMERELQLVYYQESAVLAYLAGFPQGYFREAPWNVDLPSVERSLHGPWVELASGSVHVLAGVRSHEMSPAESRDVVEGVRQAVDREIQKSPELKVLSGNRRLLGPARSENLMVLDGDLLVDMAGGKSLVGNFRAGGSLTVKGDAHYDTLRVYSAGPLFLLGKVSTDWLEAYSGDRIEMSRDFRFAGVLASPEKVVGLQNGDSILPAFARGELVPFEWRTR